MCDVVRVRYALLVLLSEGPRKGRQLREALETRPGRTQPSAAQVDTTLRRLERDGLVESGVAGTDGPEQEFRITADRGARAGRMAAHASRPGRLAS